MEVALEEPLGDVQETLDAAFALIDACIPSPSSSSSSGRSSTWELPVGRAELACVSTPEVHLPESKKTQVACASNSTVQLSKPGKKPLTHQYRQREEIARLRGEVVLLENQLNLMRVMTKKQLGAENASVGGIRERHISWDLENFVKVKRGEHSIGAVSLWRDVAARQKKLRSTSESERNHLRFMLSEQRKTIRSIKRLIIRETERQVSIHCPQFTGLCADVYLTVNGSYLQSRILIQALSSSDWTASSWTSFTKSSMRFTKELMMRFIAAGCHL